MKNNITGYRYTGGQLNHSHRYLLPSLINIMESLQAQRRVFEHGCGNRPMANYLAEDGWEIIGVDPSMGRIVLLCFEKAVFTNIWFLRIRRIPALAKRMIATAKRT
jgi:hypothetical protein